MVMFPTQRALGHGLGVRRLAVADADPGDQVADQRARDGVQHDRRDHLADPAGDPQDARDAGPQRSGQHRDEDRAHRVQVAGQQPGAGEPAGGQAGQAVLPLDADVEQVHPEADRGGDAGEVQHGRLVEDRDQVVVARPGAHRRPERVDVVAGGQEHQGGDDRRHHEGQHRCGQADQDASKEAHHSSPAPVMAEPRSWGVTVRGSKLPTRRPRSSTRMVSERPISSSRSAEISSTARPERRACSDVVPDLGLGADVDAAGRVGGDQQHRVAAHLAPHDELLLVAARERTSGGVDAGGADVVLLDDPRGVGARTRPVEPEALDRRRPGLVAEDAVLPQR